jgi:hypothetical protein
VPSSSAAGHRSGDGREDHRYRQKNGGFKKIEDLMNVRGIGESRSSSSSRWCPAPIKLNDR